MMDDPLDPTTFVDFALRQQRDQQLPPSPIRQRMESLRQGYQTDVPIRPRYQSRGTPLRRALLAIRERLMRERPDELMPLGGR